MSTATLDRNTVTGPAPGTPEWYAHRRNIIGASEAAAACGFSPYKTPLQLYLEKRGLVDGPEENDAMRLGKLLEPVVLSEYQRRAGVPDLVRDVPMLWLSDKPFIAATPDAIRMDDDERRPVEAKTTTFRRAAEFGEEGTDQIPEDYVMQAQQQMLVLGASKCDVAVMLDGRTLRLYTVHRHDALIEGIIDAETELWQRIADGNPPEPDWEHASTPKLVAALYGVTEGKTIELSEEAAYLWRQQAELGKQIEALKKDREAIRSRVTYEIGDAVFAVLPGGEKQIRRKEIVRKAYQVAESSYIDLREVKA
jgi:putative phage-type endonuclease